jgi:hypothetical protein
MDAPRKRRGVTKRRLALLTAAGACLSLVFLQLPAAHALEVTEIYEPVTGNGTWFDGLGSPYGGCGLPQDVLESQNFVALNVYNTPKDYAMYTRPMPAGDSKIGLWNNGQNCGRWVEVEISDFCTGTNDGAANSSFCRNGSWVKDKYNGAKLTLLVADSCGDPNGWCRDDPYHLDFSKSSLSKFVLPDGSTTASMMTDNKWNNRHVKWKFVDPPNYQGDLQIGFLQSAQAWWTAISVSNLPHGIHGVQYLQGGVWKDAKLNGDMGQSYIISGLKEGDTNYKIRVKDIDDKFVNNGRVYSFKLACSNQCSGAYTKATYTVESADPGVSEPAEPTDPQEPTDPEDPTSPEVPAAGTCDATFKATNTWSGGYQGEITVQAGSEAISGWTVSWTLPSGQTVSQVWNGELATSDSTVTVTNPAWGGALAANGSTTFGLVASGSATAPALTCSAR